MMHSKKRAGIGRWAACAAVVIVGIVLAGYFLSPYLHLGERIAAALSEDSGARFECRSSRLSFPFGLVFERFAVKFKDRTGANFEADRLTVRPSLTRLLTGRVVLSIQCESYGGRLDGKIEFFRNFAVKGPLKAAFTLDGVDLGQSPYLKALAGKPVSGKLTATVDFTGDTDDLLKGSGRAFVKVTGGDFQAAGISAGPSAYRNLGFNTLETEMVFQRRTLKIGRLVLEGNKIRCSLNGHLFLRDEPEKSELALNGDLQVKDLPDLKLALAVTGTLVQPLFTAI